MSSKHQFTRLCDAMADGQWLELRHEGQTLFVVGPSAGSFWSSTESGAEIVSAGEPLIVGNLLGRYLIARQLGASPDVDLRDDGAIIHSLERAGLTSQEAAELLQALDAIHSGPDSVGPLLETLHRFHKKLKKTPARGFLMDVWSSRLNAQRLGSGGIELSELHDTAEDDHQNAAVSKYIRELGTMFERLRGRLEKLELMDVRDATLNEATRAYLYGFSRSTVLLSAAAVEGALVCHPQLRPVTVDEKAARPNDRRVNAEDFFSLLERALPSGVLLPDEHHAGHSLRRLRNKVAHDGYEPTADEGADALVQGRRLVSRLIVR